MYQWFVSFGRLWWGGPARSYQSRSRAVRYGPAETGTAVPFSAS